MGFSLRNFPDEVLYLFFEEFSDRKSLLKTIICAKFLYHLFLNRRREMIVNVASKEVNDDYWTVIPVLQTAIFLIDNSITQDAFALYEGAWRSVRNAKPLAGSAIFGHDLIAHNTRAHDAVLPEGSFLSRNIYVGFQTLGVQQQIWEDWWQHVFQRDLAINRKLHIILNTVQKDESLDDEQRAYAEISLRDEAWSDEQQLGIKLALKESVLDTKERLTLLSALWINEAQPGVLKLALRDNVLNVRRAMMQLTVSSRDCGWHHMFMTAVDLMVALDARRLNLLEEEPLEEELLEVKVARRDLLVKWTQVLDDAEQFLDRSEFEEPTATELKHILQSFEKSTEPSDSWYLHVFRVVVKMVEEWGRRITNKQWGAALVAADWCDVLWDSLRAPGLKLQHNMWEMREDVQNEFWQYTFFVGARMFRDGYSCIPEVVKAWEKVVDDSPAHAHKASEYLSWFLVRTDYNLLLWWEAVESGRWEDAKIAVKPLIRIRNIPNRL